MTSIITFHDIVSIAVCAFLLGATATWLHLVWWLRPKAARWKKGDRVMARLHSGGEVFGRVEWASREIVRVHIPDIGGGGNQHHLRGYTLTFTAGEVRGAPD